MPEISEYEPGTPSWVDLGSPDVEASKAFYGGLFGWEARTSPDPDAGGYTMFVLDGHTVAGLGPLNEGDSPSWTVYVAVADADATASSIAAGGGTVFVPPMDVFDAGRLAVCADDQGARFSIWQAETHVGATLANEPGTLCWTELAVPDTGRAIVFYGGLFGWEADDTGGYVVWRLGADRMVGGLVQMGDHWPAGSPGVWSVCFLVADCDASVQQAADLGGTVTMGPVDSPYGRFAVLGDPHGAVFSVIQMGTG